MILIKSLEPRKQEPSQESLQQTSSYTPGSVSHDPSPLARESKKYTFIILASVIETRGKRAENWCWVSHIMQAEMITYLSKIIACIFMVGNTHTHTQKQNHKQKASLEKSLPRYMHTCLFICVSVCMWERGMKYKGQHLGPG